MIRRPALRDRHPRLSEATVPASGDEASLPTLRARVGLLLALATATAILLPLLAGDYMQPVGYWARVAISSAIYLGLVLLALRWDAAAFRVVRLATTYPLPAIAALFFVASLAAVFLVLDNVPHVSDEVAYQFQARTLATGSLSLPTPAEPEFFGFVHTMMDGERWYGIMNPGWPALLALGYLMDTPWIINPLLGALSVLVFAALLRAAGYTPAQWQLAVLLMAVSPFVLFMSATYMAHTANLFLFLVFAWAWVRMMRERSAWFAALAGLALTLNLLVRPIDAAMAAVPFFIYLLLRLRHDPGLVKQLALVGVIASLGVLFTWWYNAQLTGDGRLMPMAKYFLERDPGQRFGLGFGPDMGTTLHGPEFPGYYPSDAVRVSSYRLAQLSLDVHGLPLLLLAICGLTAFRADWRRNPWHGVLLASGLTLLGIYVLHFYHGVAYGSRHYFLAVPALAVAIALPLAGWLAAPLPVSRYARAALAALLVYVLTMPYADLLPEYGRNYRQASGALREEVERRDLTAALVFVAEDGWAWKSAFPLNTYPLGSGDVIFAKDRGADNLRLMRRFAGRAYYHVRIRGGSAVELTALPAAADVRPR
ncbi:MAG: hypothetical protein ACRELD_00975 [Longimicrobiales bacterium]